MSTVVVIAGRRCGPGPGEGGGEALLVRMHDAELQRLMLFLLSVYAFFRAERREATGTRQQEGQRARVGVHIT